MSETLIEGRLLVRLDRYPEDGLDVVRVKHVGQLVVGALQEIAREVLGPLLAVRHSTGAWGFRDDALEDD